MIRRRMRPIYWRKRRTEQSNEKNIFQFFLRMLKWLILVTVVAAIDIKDQTLDKPELVKFLLPEEKQYMDWWKITPDNFNQRVFSEHDEDRPCPYQG